MRSLSISLALALSVAAPALGGTADFTGSLQLFIGDGNGLPATPITIPGSATGVSFGSAGSAFTIPSGVFVTNASSPVGFTPLAAPNSIYTIRTVTNTANNPGSFSGTAGTGPYGGIMGIGSSILVELGVVPLPSVFGSLFIPLDMGSPGTETGMAFILANALTITVVNQGWTTATVSFTDQTLSPITGTISTFGTAMGTNNLTASGGQITLVSPVLIKIRGAATENRAGYQALVLAFGNKVPEPGPVLVMLAATGGLAMLGRRRAR